MCQSLPDILYNAKGKNRKSCGAASDKSAVQTRRAGSASGFHTLYLPSTDTSRNPTVSSPHTLLTLKNLALLEFI